MTVEDIAKLLEDEKVYITTVTFKKGAVAYKKGTLLQYSSSDVEKIELSDSSYNLCYTVNMPNKHITAKEVT